MIITKQEAIERNLTRFFTGKPCHKGHISERLTNSGNCITCKQIKERARYKSNPEKFRVAKNHWYSQTSDARKQTQWEYSLKKYGIDVTIYNQMLKDQQGVCFICKSEDTRGHRLAVDHCHKTGKVRSLLCGSCNITLGLIKENPDTLNKMINYLCYHKSIPES